MMNKKLQAYGPWALVTGGSEGIGKEIAFELARNGINCVIVARRKDRLEKVSYEIQVLGVQCRVLVADLSKAEDRKSVLDATANLDIGIFIAAAGFGSHGLFLDSSLDQDIKMVEVNCIAVTDLTYQFAHRFVGRGSGAIMLFSSIVAFQGVPRSAVYAATKAFNQSLAEALKLEFKPKGIQVLSIAPAMVESGFAHEAGMKMGMAAKADGVARIAVRKIGRSGTFRPGFLANLLGLTLKLVPRWASARIMGGVMGSMGSD